MKSFLAVGYYKKYLMKHPLYVCVDICGGGFFSLKTINLYLLLLDLIWIARVSKISSMLMLILDTKCVTKLTFQVGYSAVPLPDRKRTMLAFILIGWIY